MRSHEARRREAAAVTERTHLATELKLDIKATERPVSTWRLHNPLPPLQIRITPPPGGLNEADITRPACDPNQADAQYDTPTVLNQAIPEML